MSISVATQDDIPALVSLLNSAYRGDGSKKGWTTEADLLRGELRTDAATLSKLMQSAGAVFLKYVDEEGVLKGCVFLHNKENKLYLGMLSVSPLAQAEGIGKKLMQAAVIHAELQNCTHIFMKVISVRHELIAWYARQGYADTGAREAFPIDERFGIPTQPLEFIIMEKKL